MHPAVFFPVTPAPLSMRAGLHPWGTDFGNGPRDHHAFLIDDERDAYRKAKAAIADDRHHVVADTDGRRAIHRSVLTFMKDRLYADHGISLDVDVDAGDYAGAYARVASAVQEDFAVIARGEDDVGDTIAINVCFPSGWRPERLVGKSFAGIHTPVPEFVKKPAAAESMVRAMVERGPYVRFVWTVSADAWLDHHPDFGRRDPWRDDAVGFLRVERQSTFPFPDVGGSLFLIRTLLRPFSSLSAHERETLSAAIAAMPDDIAAYKSLSAKREILGAIARAP
jgi:hypothetical protein